MSKLKTAIGFHMSIPANADGIGNYWRKMFESGNAVIAKGVDTAGPVNEVQEMRKNYPNVPAYGIYRISSFSWGHDIPNYTIDPNLMAEAYWNEVDEKWPPELDKEWVWVEFPNEVDKEQSEWLGELAVACGAEALLRGYKYLCPAWSGGEPEPEHWALSSWQMYIQLCNDNPDRLGISLHEYTFRSDVKMLDTEPLGLIGRVQELNKAAVNAGNEPPAVFITEWGYGATNAPHHSFGVPDMIETVDWYIRNTPNVLGVLIWCLDSGWQWGQLARKINGYIQPMGDHIVATDWPEKEALPIEPPIEPPPQEEKHKVVIVKLAQEHNSAAWAGAAEYAFEHYKRSITASSDDMMTMLRSGNNASRAIIADPERASQKEAIEILEAEGFKYEIIYLEDTPHVPHVDLFAYRPCATTRVTQIFGANPQNYIKFGLPGHDGIDYGVGRGLPYYAVQGGVVVHASNQRPSGGASAWGFHVIIRHLVNDITFHTVYAHATPDLPVKKGDEVKAGEVVGYSGNTGNSTGYHLHFNLLWESNPGNGFPRWTYGYAVDPWPYLEGKDRPPIVSPATVDLFAYLCGDGRLYELANADGGQERLQTQRPSTTEFWQTKEWLAEQLFVSNNSIYRGWDTSSGNNRYYQQQQPMGTHRAKWMPRHMTIGEYFSVSLWVQFYNWDCVPSPENSGQVIDTRRFVQHFDTWTSRAGITIDDVIQLEWVNGGETYFYGKHFGLVGWERTHQDPHTPAWSAISEIHAPGQRPDNVVRLPGCL